MRVTNALRHWQYQVWQLRRMIDAHHEAMGWGNPAEELPPALEMLYSALREAEDIMGRCAARVHAMQFGLGAQVHPIPTSSPVIEEIGCTDTEDAIDDTIAQPCEVQEATGAGDLPEGAVYCEVCQGWHNSQRQYEDHLTGKKHQKNVDKAQRGNASSAVVVTSAPDDTEVVGGFDLMKRSDMWLWLEKGKKEKEAEESAQGEDGEEQKPSRSKRWRRRRRQEAERIALAAEDFDVGGPDAAGSGSA